MNPVCPKCYEGVSFEVTMHLNLAPPTKPLFVSCAVCKTYIGSFDKLPADQENETAATCPILSPTEWDDLRSEVGRLVSRFGVFNVREALDTFRPRKAGVTR